MGDEKRRVETDGWVASLQALIESGVSMPPLNLPAASGSDLAEVELDLLCDSILADLKIPGL